MGEDGIAGISDDKQRVCLSVALWNERDPILKERLFGLTNAEGNHGEDVKEYYFYVDNLPTHSYERYLYKYPQAEFPYNDLVATNRGRSRHDFEYELLDTGVFADDEYFDVEIEHAKAGPEDIVCRVTVHNRSARDAALHVLPTLWFRNAWSWPDGEPKPRLARVEAENPAVRADHQKAGTFFLYAEPDADLLFCENETNTARVFGAEPTTQFPKDGIGDHVIRGADTVNPAGEGTKVAARTRLVVPAGGQAAVLVRLTREGPQTLTAPLAGANDLIAARRAEADEFYDAITPPAVTDDAKAVMRQALAGHAVVQAVLLLRRRPLAAGSPVPPAARADPARDPQRVLVPHVQPRRGVHAGQVGVPLVRRLGPGLPLHPARPWWTRTSPRARST